MRDLSQSEPCLRCGDPLVAHATRESAFGPLWICEDGETAVRAPMTTAEVLREVSLDVVAAPSPTGGDGG